MVILRLADSLAPRWCAQTVAKNQHLLCANYPAPRSASPVRYSNAPGDVNGFVHATRTASSLRQIVLQYPEQPSE